MNEKRFSIELQNNDIYDKETNTFYCDNDSICNLLNEQDDELHKYRTENAELHITILENGKEIDEQQATIDILLEELVNAQQQGYVVNFLHKNEHCSLIPKELEDE